MSRERCAGESGVFGRREFLVGGVGFLSALTLPRTGRADDSGAGQFPGLILREKEPLNLEFPFATLRERTTPTPRFFVRCHFAVPKIEVRNWSLTVGGEVEDSLTLSYDELRKMPSVTVGATLECAGNARAFLTPRAKGLLWQFGAVGHAEWTGVRLSDVLKRAGLKDKATEVILHGADKGTVNDEPKSPGPIHFERSISRKKALAPEVILAYQMNGEDLTPEHGFPVRAVVPGWYGMSSVKWLTHVTATADPFRGYWQTLDYAYWEQNHGRPSLTAVTEMQVKSQIARPALYETIPAKSEYRVFGAAWGGESPVEKVEVSIDDGDWKPAKLLGEPIPFGWRFWELPWQTPAAGKHTLRSRATDAAGNVQPLERDVNRRTYMISHSIPIEVSVGS